MQQLVRWCVVAMAGLGVACGEVGNTPAADAAIDAAPAPVRATVLTASGDGSPDTTAKVVFQDPDGTVVSDTAVDAMGRAQAVLPRGGTVTAIRITTDTMTTLFASVTTITGVKPGDDLTFGLKAAATITNQGGQTTMTATFPLASDATLYQFFTPCGFSGSNNVSPVTLNFRDSCHGTTFDLLGVASGGSLTTPRFVKLTSVNYQSGGSFNIPLSFSTMAPFTVNLTNVPDAVSNMSVNRSSMIGNQPVATTNASVTGDPPAGDVSITLPFPQGVGTRSELLISMNHPDAAHNQWHEVHTATLGTSATMDLGKQQLPWFRDLVQTPTGATWTMVAAGDAPDGMMTQWSGRWTSGTRSVLITWSVAQPAEMAGMTLPRLPAAYAMLDPGQQTVAVKPSFMTLYMADYDNLTGYDELRQMPETLLVPSIGNMGAFVGLSFQRRVINPFVFSGF
jgi:hypothetical protein